METKAVHLQSLQLNSVIEVNPSYGVVSGSVNVPLLEGRNGFDSELSLSYNSSSANSIFGPDWNLSGTSNISIDASKGLAKYDGSDWEVDLVLRPIGSLFWKETKKEIT